MTSSAYSAIAAHKPVFLHGAWRSGTTFYWSRFRALSDTLCFYEPLHHGLAKLTQKRIGDCGDETACDLGHPALSRPYFAEYAPLIAGRGVRHYQRSLAYERFHLGATETYPALRRYVGGLIDHAAALGRRPVFGFNRTGGRVDWLKARFNGFDIHIDREPAAIWASYAAEQARGNTTFFSMWLRILEANQGHPLWAPLAERLKVRGPIARRLTQMKLAHARQIAGMTAEDSYLLVFYAWLATAPASMAACDLVIDDGLLAQRHYARRIEDAVETGTGLRPDLSAAECRRPRASLDEAVRRRVEAEALSLFPRGAAARLPLPIWGSGARLCARKAEILAALG